MSYSSRYEWTPEEIRQVEGVFAPEDVPEALELFAPDDWEELCNLRSDGSVTNEMLIEKRDRLLAKNARAFIGAEMGFSPGEVAAFGAADLREMHGPAEMRDDWEIKRSWVGDDGLSGRVEYGPPGEDLGDVPW